MTEWKNEWVSNFNVAMQPDQARTRSPLLLPFVRIYFFWRDYALSCVLMGSAKYTYIHSYYDLNIFIPGEKNNIIIERYYDGGSDPFKWTPSKKVSVSPAPTPLLPFHSIIIIFIIIITILFHYLPMNGLFVWKSHFWFVLPALPLFYVTITIIITQGDFHAVGSWTNYKIIL